MITYMLLSFRKKLRLWSTFLSLSHTLLQKILQLNTCTSLTPLVLNPGTASKKWIISCWIPLPPNRLQFKFTRKFTLPSDTSYCNRQYTQIPLLANTTPDPWTKTWSVSLINCNNTDQNSPRGARAPGALQLQTLQPRGITAPSLGRVFCSRAENTWQGYPGREGNTARDERSLQTWCQVFVLHRAGEEVGGEGLFGGLHTPARLMEGDERGHGTETGWDRVRKPFGPKQTIQYFPFAWSIAIQFDFPEKRQQVTAPLFALQLARVHSCGRRSFKSEHETFLSVLLAVSKRASWEHPWALQQNRGATFCSAKSKTILNKSPLLLDQSFPFTSPSTWAVWSTTIKLIIMFLQRLDVKRFLIVFRAQTLQFSSA